MKNLKRLAFLLMLVCMGTSFVACSDDDDDKKEEEKIDVRNDMVGVWEGYKFEMQAQGQTITEKQFLQLLEEQYRTDEVLESLRKQYSYECKCDESLKQLEENPFTLSFGVLLTNGEYLNSPGELQATEVDNLYNGVFNLSNLNIQDFNNSLYENQKVEYLPEANEVKVTTDFSDVMEGAKLITYYRISSIESNGLLKCGYAPFNKKMLK